MKLFKTIWSIINPLADIVGILGFFGISIKNFNFTKIPWYLYFLLSLFSLILLKIIINKLKDIKQIYKETKTVEDLERISSQTNIQNINSVLPTTSTLKWLYEKVKVRMNNWAEDAVIKSVYLYLDYSSNSWEKPHIQVVAYSKWKNEEGWFYEGKFKSENYNENQHVSVSKSVTNDCLFFNLNENWQLMVKKAFGAISNKLTNECSIMIGEESINITFSEGKVKKTKKFNITDNFSKIVPE